MKVLLDTGPLVALINPHEQFHHWVVSQANRFKPPFYTCEAVLSEAHFILGSAHNRRLLLALLDSGRLDVTFSYDSHATRVHELIRKYDDVPISFADACMIRMAEIYSEGAVFTLDSDFSFYRKHRNQRLDVIMP